MERCPSWLKEHDWRSCVGLVAYRGFESLPLRHIISIIAFQENIKKKIKKQFDCDFTAIEYLVVIINPGWRVSDRGFFIHKYNVKKEISRSF
jgi:hypothetical protein